MIRRTLLSLFLILALFQLGAGQNGPLDQAKAAARAGNHEQAAHILETILHQEPDNLSARLLQAHNFSWWRRFDLSIPAFEDILRDHPGQLDASIGYGYAYLWAKRPGKATRIFREVLLNSPGQVEAWKGLAYALEVSGNAKEANLVFSDLSEKDPTQTEYRLGMARTYLALGEYRLAKAEMKRSGSEEMLRDLKLRPAVLEADLWGGMSSVEGNQTWNIRAAQLAYRINKHHFLYARYDNSLSMDNLDFVRNQQTVPSWTVGGVTSWNDRWITRLEIGARDLPTSGLLPAFRAEQILTLPSALQVKTGLWMGYLSEGAWEGLAYAGAYLPLTDQLGLEPMYYHAKERIGIAPQHRFSLAGKWHNDNGIEWLAGAFYGRQRVENILARESVAGGFSTALIPLNRNFRLLLAATYEQGLLDNNLALSAGIRYRLLE